MTMQVQYSERDSDHGSNGVVRGGGVVANNGGGVGSRERLAPPSSSSESLGGDLKSTYHMFWGNSGKPLCLILRRKLASRQYANKFRMTEALMVVVFFLELKRGQSS